MKKSNNILFFLCCFACIVLFASPLILRFIPHANDLLGFFLEPLDSTAYKVTYIETMGAIFGSFLAITGAIWTQQKMDDAKEKKEIQTTAIIIYLELDTTFKNIKHILKAYFNNTSDRTINVLNDIDGFKKELALHPLNVDKKLSQHIARISEFMSDDEFTIIERIYAYLIDIQFLVNDDELTDAKLKLAYSRMNYFFNLDFSLSDPIVYDYSLKNNVQEAYDKIRTIAGFN